MTSSIPLWRHIQRNNFTQIKVLCDYLELDESNRQKILYSPRFPLNLPQRLANKIAKNCLTDPIFRQFVPLCDEQVPHPDFVPDPVQDACHRKTNKILHKYHGRALLVTTSACAMHCRYCFRQNFAYETQERTFDEDLSYLSTDSSIKEIILSGGDPLSLSDSTLTQLLTQLDAIQHLDRIRIHTRFPIGIPERIDDSFLHLLAACKKQLFFVIHANHPRELDLEVLQVLKRIQRLGIPVLNQSVLLKGVNDTEDVFLSLAQNLVNAGILPYYLHALDPVQGSSHFALADERGHQLLHYVQTHLSGYGVPKFVREESGQPSKTPLNSKLFLYTDKITVY